jgi:hypothetical protein
MVEIGLLAYTSGSMSAGNLSGWTTGYPELMGRAQVSSGPITHPESWLSKSHGWPPPSLTSVGRELTFAASRISTE